MGSKRGPTEHLSVRPSKRWRSSPTHVRYQYADLPTNTIRLVRLAMDTENEELEGELITVYLGELPKFRAISYAWGEKHEHGYAHLYLPDGESIAISKNLALALRQFKKSFGSTPILLWADQICINQMDEAEKEDQIYKMAEIFSEAEEVLVWLGEANPLEHIAEAIWAVNALRNFPRKERTLLSLHSFLSKRVTSSTGPCSMNAPQNGNRKANQALIGLESIFTQSWFERLWVRQEIAVAKKATFYRGNNTVSSASLENATRIYFKILKNTLSSEDWSTSRNIATAANIIDAVARAEYMFDLVEATRPKQYDRPNLLDILRFTLDLAATNPADRVYAIFQFSCAASSIKLLPEYAKPLPTLWRQFAALMLKDTMIWNTFPEQDRICPAAILALSATQERAKSKEMPSWVPEVDALGSRSTHKFDHYLFYSRTYAAGGKGEFSPIIDQNGRKDLRLSGVICASVMSTLTGSQQPSLWPIETRTGEKYWPFIRGKLIPWYTTCYDFAAQHHRVRNSQRRFEGFSTLLSQGVVSDGKKGGPDFNTFVKKAMIIDPSGHNQDFTREMFDCLRPFIGWDAWEIDHRDSGRIMATFSDGRIGWVPESTGTGDEVLLVQGATFPFIVRRVTKQPTYGIIGDAYIEGVMKGEVWKEMECDVGTFSIT